MRVLGIAVVLFVVLAFGPSVSSQNCAVTVQPGQSLQQAINTVSEGALVCIAAGTFTENITIAKSLSLRGAGRPQTIIQGAVRVEHEREIQVALTGCTVTGSRFGAGIRIGGKANVTLEDLAVTESFSGVLALGAASVTAINFQSSGNQFDGVRAEGSARVTLKNANVFDNGGDGLVVRDSAELALSESVIENNKRCGLRVFSGKISGTPNKMGGNGADLCGFAPASVRKPLVPQTEKPQLAVPGDFQTIQEALDAIAPGGTVLVQNGTYEVGLTLWKPVTLRGTAILKPLPERQLVLSTTAEAQAVVIEAFTITEGRGDGLLLYGQITLRTVRIASHADDGVEIAGSAVIQMINTVISDNGDDGLFLSEKAQLTLTDSHISSNGGDGLEARDSSTVKLQNTQVSNNRLRGLDVRIATQLELVGSRIVSNKSDGLVARDSAQVRLDTVQITNNGGDGVVITDKALGTIIAATISGNGGDGIESSGAASVEVRRSAIEKNGTAEECSRADSLCNGLVVIGDVRLRLVDSAIRANTDWGIMSWLRRCGAPFDFFRGQVVFEGANTIEGNNRSGNHKGNPGTHPFTGLPDGQVCLP